MAGIANATSNIAAGNASLGDALAFLPVMTVGVQKLRGAPTNSFIAGTLVAVAGVNAGTGTADAGPASASKPIEEIQVGDFVWARAEHDPSAPAVLQKVVALYRNTAHDLQQLEVVGDQGQSVQIVATDEHPFYVVDVGWTTADAVQVGQKLVGAGGAVLTVVANRDWKPDGGVVVYNFQVEGDHTYFVGDIHAQGEWMWTHNMCAADKRIHSPSPISGLPRTGSALKGDANHAFPDLVDNFVADAQTFLIPTKGPGGAIVRYSRLFQLGGSLRGDRGVFEWIVDQGAVTHRRFIIGGSVTGFPNQHIRHS